MMMFYERRRERKILGDEALTKRRDAFTGGEKQ